MMHTSHTVRLIVLSMLILVPSVLAEKKESKKQKQQEVEDTPSALFRFLPKGLPQKNVRLPQFSKNTKGKNALSSLVEADVMIRHDDHVIDLENLLLTQYNEAKKADFKVKLPKGKFNNLEQTLTGEKDSHVESPDFEMVGDSLLFQVEEKKGKMVGNILMTINNSDAFKPADPAVAVDRTKTENLPPTYIKTGPSGSAYMDLAKNTLIFLNDVHLQHPQFELWCDELQIYLKKKPKEIPEEEPDASTEESAEGDEEDEGVTIVDGTDMVESKEEEMAEEETVEGEELAEAPDTMGGIEIAVALGEQVLIKKLDQEGKSQAAQCQRAIFYADDGDVILQLQPNLQMGNNLIQSTSKDTQIFLLKNGRHRVVGPHINRITNFNPN